MSAPEDVAKAALAWLAATELTDGLFVTEFDGTAYPDQGLTLDVLVAALAAGDDALAQKLERRRDARAVRPVGRGGQQGFDPLHGLHHLLAPRRGQGREQCGGLVARALLQRLEHLAPGSGERDQALSRVLGAGVAFYPP